MNERLAAAWRLLPNYLGQHVLLSASALTLGVLISLPLAVAASRNPRLRWIASHCLKAGKAAAGLRNYYCMPADAG